jgi:hypothetical protein
MNHKPRMMAALVGGSAVLTMGALSLAYGQEQTGAPTAAKSSTMEIGSTTTDTTPAATPAIPMAVPTMKGPAPLPSEEQAAE